jgi:hypothetical protein
MIRSHEFGPWETFGGTDGSRTDEMIQSCARCRCAVLRPRQGLELFLRGSARTGTVVLWDGREDSCVPGGPAILDSVRHG